MKRIPTFIIFLILTVHLSAQSFERGGMGDFMIGPSWIFASKIDDYLNRPDVLGASYTPVHLGLSIGGEGFCIRDRVLIGGGLNVTSIYLSSAGAASLNESSVAGYFKTGYIFWDQSATFMNVNFGIGFMEHSFQIRNDRAPEGIYFNQELPVRLGEQRWYSYDGLSLDLGYGIKSVLGKKNNSTRISGVILGIDAGCLLNIGMGRWSTYENMNEYIVGPPDPGLSTVPYIRFTIGGGGFSRSVPLQNGVETPHPGE